MDKILCQKINQYVCELTIAQRNFSILHWNLCSQNFIEFHEYYGNIYEKLADFIDIAAEQVRFKGKYIQANIVDCATIAKLASINCCTPYSLKQSLEIAISMIEYLNYHVNIIISLANQNDIFDVVDVFTQQSIDYGKILYFLKSSTC